MRVTYLILLATICLLTAVISQIDVSVLDLIPYQLDEIINFSCKGGEVGNG